MLHRQNTFQATLYEDEFPSLSETGTKDFTNVNISSTANSLSYCAKLKTSPHEKIKNFQLEKGIWQESFYKQVASKSIQTPKQDLTTNSHFSFGNQMFLRKLSENSPTKKNDSCLLSNNHVDDQELVSFSDQSDEKDKGWVVVKKKVPHLQAEENNKIFNKTKIQYRNFLKNQTTSVDNVPLPKPSVQNMQHTSKKRYFFDSKITSSNKLSSLQNKVTGSDKKNVSNNSKNLKFQREKIESGENIDFKRDEMLHKPKYKDSNKQSKNISFHINYSTFSKQNQFVKERNSSQNEKLHSTDNLQKEQLSILSKTEQKSFETFSSLSKPKADNFPKNKAEYNKKISPKNDFMGFTNQNIKDSNKSFCNNFSGNKHTMESKKNSNISILGSSKKKRKSKVKRQVAMQSDKIRIITPEMYSKITNSSKDEKVQTPKNITVNIYDSNEYPELGSSLISEIKSEKDGFEIFSKKDTAKKFSLMIEKSDIDSGIIESSEENSDYLKDHDVSVESNFIEDEGCELKKIPVHYNNPITISLFDMLSVNKPKKKETEKSKEFSMNLLPSKFSFKKQTSSDHHQNVNPLDSSKPAVKRGKEREKPKPKRLSKFKKIILLDREKRKEKILKQYMWNKLYEEKDVFSHTAKLSEVTNEKSLMKLSTSNFNNVEMQQLSQINNRDGMFIKVECGNQPGHTKLHLDSSLENNLNTCGLKSKNEMNFPEEKSISKINPSCTESTETFVENAACDLTSQMHSNNIKYKMRLEERKRDTKEHKSETEVHNIAFEELEHVGELSKLSKTVKNHFSNSALINKTESNKCVSSLTTLSKDTYFETDLNEIQCLIENWDASNQFTEEQNLDEILYDIQHLFLDEGEINIFSCKGVSAELHHNFINDVKNNKKTSNSLYNLSIDDMHIPEKMEKDCSFVDTVCCNFENIGKIGKYKESETENRSEKRVNGGLHYVYSDKEIVQAANIILHSKKFRDYCNHFSSKELGEIVLALLDDLTRFQDRIHQKDPIKARMKRRLIYGIKEIKRHVKLKKLKCIIIATDIEDSKTEGSLNDIINDLKALAKDYHVPCIFSHLRKKLGQVCHKPAWVSAVGVLNYEGSEVNFKKMLELHSECKMDYEKVLKAFLSKLTNVQVELLHTTKAKDSASLHSVVTSVLKELFLQSNGTVKSNNQNSENLPDEVSVLKGSHKCINEDAEVVEISNILIKYKILN